ncbi:hypothetical protein V8C42DRAFT_154782 [Trichoderma barbatum]
MDSSQRKRKRLELASSSEDEDEALKKVRVASAGHGSVVYGPAEPPHLRRDVSQQLPAEVWHHIFSFLTPDTLGRLLSVNRLFHKFLDPASPFSASLPVFHMYPALLPTLSPDAIWRASRRLHWPNMPAPLKGRSELNMWRFACSRSCQLCGQLDKAYATENSSRCCGPGNTTVAPIFPFFINTCGNCLVEKSVKEIDLLLSTSNPSFILPGLPMVFLTPDVNVISPQAMRNAPVPTDVQLTKVYWPSQVESLQSELEEVKRFGVAAAEEWIKGLDSRGTKAIHDASRWDRWYLSGGVHQMRIHSSSTQSVRMAVGKDISTAHLTSRKSSQLRRNPPRQAREEMEELKSKRRADIEARSAQLHPPILPGVLGNLSAFQMALERNLPLDEVEWKLLKPLLLLQRDKMEQMEKRGVAKAKPQQKHQTPQDIERRAHISRLADQAIGDRLVKGRSLKKENCAGFAAEVLAYVRKQCYSDGAKPVSAKRRLTLDDMRWVFDHKLGPLTNHYQKESFICRGCANSKLFGFHAVVQHYAAKHSSNMAKKMALLWREEWPEELPFESSPAELKTTASSKQHHSQGPEDSDLLNTKVNAMAKIIRPAWNALNKTKKIPTSVKVSVLIHRIAKGYQEQYGEPAPLEIFLDGLDHHTSFSVVSKCQGLACKVCMSSQEQVQTKKSLFSLSDLAHHFHGVHDKKSNSPTDWCVDMVWLPDMRIMQGLHADICTNKAAFRLISDAFPWFFKGEVERSDHFSLGTRQSPIIVDSEAINAGSKSTMHHYSNERWPPNENTPNLLPVNVVYAGSNRMHEQPRYRADVSPTQSISERISRGHEGLDRMATQYIVRGPGEWNCPTWESTHLSSRGVGSRQAVLEPSRPLETYYLHREHAPYMAEAVGSYPYYPDMELRRERSYMEVEARHTSRQPYVSGYRQPMSSTPLYGPYDRYDVVNVQSLPNDHYIERPTISHNYRIPSNADYSNYTNREPHNNTAPTSQVYNAYDSRYSLSNRRSGGRECDVEID